MSRKIVTQHQKDLLDMLKSLGADEKMIMTARPMIEDKKRAEKIMLKLIELYDAGEIMTAGKVLEIMKTV